MSKLLNKATSGLKNATNKVISKCQRSANLKEDGNTEMSQTFWEKHDKISALQAQQQEVSNKALDEQRASVTMWENRIAEILKRLNKESAVARKIVSKFPATTKMQPANGSSFMVERDAYTGLFSIVSFKMSSVFKLN